VNLQPAAPKVDRFKTLISKAGTFYFNQVKHQAERFFNASSAAKLPMLASSIRLPGFYHFML